MRYPELFRETFVERPGLSAIAESGEDGRVEELCTELRIAGFVYDGFDRAEGGPPGFSPSCDFRPKLVFDGHKPAQVNVVLDVFERCRADGNVLGARKRVSHRLRLFDVHLEAHASAFTVELRRHLGGFRWCVGDEDYIVGESEMVEAFAVNVDAVAVPVALLDDILKNGREEVRRDGVALTHSLLDRHYDAALERHELRVAAVVAVLQRADVFLLDALTPKCGPYRRRLHAVERLFVVDERQDQRAMVFAVRFEKSDDREYVVHRRECPSETGLFHWLCLVQRSSDTSEDAPCVDFIEDGKQRDGPVVGKLFPVAFLEEKDGA